MSKRIARARPSQRVTEFSLIAAIRSAVARGTAGSDRVTLGIGDDCAAIRFTPGRETLITTDMLMDGRHFRTEEHSFEEIGAKAMAVNLSDIAAMAGKPVAAVVSVALPSSLGPERMAVAMGELHQGLARVAEQFDVALVGGDTNAWDGRLVINVTVLGETTARGLVRRNGARPGDAILVTGRLGGSILGRHMSPRPRVREALALHETIPIHAMIDISDGLAADLGHILEESGGLGARLDAAAIPVSNDAMELARRDGRTPLEHALGDGEDFELCFTVSEGDARRLLETPPPGVALWRIGHVVAEPGFALLHADAGRVEPIEPTGFDHLAQRRRESP